jgi:hypothetical protein
MEDHCHGGMDPGSLARTFSSREGDMSWYVILPERGTCHGMSWYITEVSGRIPVSEVPRNIWRYSEGTENRDRPDIRHNEQ